MPNFDPPNTKQISWQDTIIKDFHLQPEDLSGLTEDYEKLYSMLKELKENLPGTFFPLHTQNFINRHGLNRTLLSLAVGQLNPENFSHDECKELQLLAAYFGQKKLLHTITTDMHLSVDHELVNMALLSGAFLGEELAQLVSESPLTYNSIKYAIRSGNSDLLRELLDIYELKAGNEHLIVAASSTNREMTQILLAKGFRSEGPFFQRVTKADADSFEESPRSTHSKRSL